MGYVVRSEGGEVKFQSLYEIQRAIANGLVDPEDELTEDGQAAWRKISTVAALRDARPEPSGFWKTDVGKWVIPLCALLGVSLVLLFSPRYWVAGLGLAIFLALVLSQLTFKVFSKRRVR
ncbi:MAG TPA: hypothetical protein VIG99_13070 [Myxococcaceae bacterium]|jgi:hypothetical protein